MSVTTSQQSRMANRSSTNRPCQKAAASASQARVSVVGWSPPWVFVMSAPSTERSTVEVLRGPVGQLGRLLPADGNEDVVVTFTQRWPLKYVDGVLTRTAGLGATVVASRATDRYPGFPDPVGTIGAVEGQRSVPVEHVATLSVESDLDGLDDDLRQAVTDWRSRRCCEINECRELLPPGKRVCDGHLVDWRRQLLDQAGVLESRIEEHHQNAFNQYRARATRRAVDESSVGSPSGPYRGAPCENCAECEYRHEVVQGHPMGPGTMRIAVCTRCGYRYCAKRSGRTSRVAEEAFRAEIDSILKRGWRIEGFANPANRTVDAPAHWPTYGIGSRVQTRKKAAQERHQKSIDKAQLALDQARDLADHPQDTGNPTEAADQLCKECGWPFGPKHRYTGGPSCAVLRVTTKLSNGEWVRLPTTGAGVRKMIDQWPNQCYGPIAFGHSSQYGLGINKGRALQPIINGETAAITLARVQLSAANTGVSLDQALGELLEI